jgi:hypothetical protein
MPRAHSAAKLSDEQRAVIVENDPVAQEKLRELWRKAASKEITPEKARRLQSNIEGIAIEKWRRACFARGQPLSSLPQSEQLVKS